MKPVRLAALALLCAFPAASQQRSPTSGVPQPVQSFAVSDDATALAGNPAALGFTQGLLLEYAGARGYGTGMFRGDGAYFSLSAWGAALGTSLEWLHESSECTPATPCSRRFSLGAALRADFVAIGAAHHGFSSDESVDLDHLGSWDVGILARPARWLSLGYTAVDVNGPSLGATQLPRRHVAAVGLRPIDEWLTLATDVTFRSCTSDGAGCGIGHPDWGFTGEAPLTRGLQLVGRLGVTDAGTTSAQIGIQIDFGRFGVRTAAAFPGNGGTGSQLTVVRVSSVQYPALSITTRDRAVQLDLDEALRRPPPNFFGVLLGETHRDPLALTVEQMHRLARDGGVRAVVLRSGGLPLGAGRSEELRSGIEELQAAGKKVAFYVESAGDLDYSVASAADRVYAAPQAVLAVNGFSATALFAAAGLDKLGVKAEFVRAGAYKNAPDVFTRSDMSSEQREVTNALLDDVYGRYVRRVSLARHLDEEKFRRLLDRGLLTPQEAQAEGLVDAVLYPDQLEQEVGKLIGGRVKLDKIGTEPEARRSVRWAPPPKVAVVRVEGDIARGQGGSDPLGVVEVAGSETIARRIHRLADDSSVKAIVVRIDSPGGDGNASDLIWRELVRAREKGKPVVASMGDVAASGGYYVAVAADQIYAEPSTITGSIGVFIGKFDLEELYRTLGLKLVTNKRGKSADLFSTARMMTPEERTMMQQWVDASYALFVERVAQGRHMPRERVAELARGRVWSGQQALERGLVDKLGGFRDAIAAAKVRAGIAPDDPVVVDDPGKREVSVAPVLQFLPGALKSISERTVRALSLLGEPGTVRAALPFDLEVN
ncbi:MAG TPA: signal peptide peptidase SppA [Myxococcales bacterium]|nr:signal peptide peptidase SppA [Myxococcales bacterium]